MLHPCRVAAGKVEDAFKTFVRHELAGFGTAPTCLAIDEVGFVFVQFFDLGGEVGAVKIQFRSTFDFALCRFFRRSHVEEDDIGAGRLCPELGYVEVLKSCFRRGGWLGLRGAGRQACEQKGAEEDDFFHDK